MGRDKRPPPRGVTGKTRTRCAIYTRKSSEEGLEQAFNSLDAQRETCEAYVASQKHEGWSALPAMFDDGGISGGTLDRPALTRLLTDIAQGRVDTVVVYKVDRLTRSLSDFAKIVEVFERHGVTFVSVTQSFSTTTSMGRLTLNMLLSFAQFEREVAGERIRDKIAASKRKGMWMGGLPPLGYDVVDRKLVINESEAETIRHVLRRYAALGSVRALQDELETAGVKSKRRVDRFSRETGGKPLSRGALYLMLQNRLYRGEITHKGNSYPGEHKAIIDEQLWDAVQSRLAANRVERKTGVNATEPSLLVGLVYDEAGERMTPTHANKKGIRYRYYVSHSLIRRGRLKVAEVGRRIPAGELEQLVEERIIEFINDASAIFEAVKLGVEDTAHRAAMIGAAKDLAGRWPDLEKPERRAMLQRLVRRIDLSRDTARIRVRTEALRELVAPDSIAAERPQDDGPAISLSVPIRLRRAGKENRLRVASDNDAQPVPDRSLVRLLAQAHRYRELALKGDDRSMGELAQDAGVTPSYFTRVLRVSFLSPKIVRAILDGRQPQGLSARGLIQTLPRLPRDWAGQESALRLA